MTLPITQNEGMQEIINFLQQSPDKEEFIKALKSLRIDQLKDMVKNKVKQEKFKREKVFIDFLNDRQKAACTIKTYKQEINKFFDWIDKKEIHLFDVKRLDINQYIINMQKKHYANNTQRLGLAALSSWFKYLEAESYILKSPFIQIKYPHKIYKKAIRTDQERTIPVLNSTEYQVIMAELENRSNLKGKRICTIRAGEAARKLIPVISIMAGYGLRIGSIPQIEINKEENYFSVIVKGGKILTFNLSGDTIDLLKKYNAFKRHPFQDIKPANVEIVLKRITRELKEKGKIRYAYTPHDFRHFFACTFYQESKDIVKLCRMLGHSTINITDIYLQNIGIN